MGSTNQHCLAVKIDWGIPMLQPYCTQTDTPALISLSLLTIVISPFGGTLRLLAMRCSFRQIYQYVCLFSPEVCPERSFVGRLTLLVMAVRQGARGSEARRDMCVHCCRPP